MNSEVGTLKLSFSHETHKKCSFLSPKLVGSTKTSPYMSAAVDHALMLAYELHKGEPTNRN
jgi:hypothetical protein